MNVTNFSIFCNGTLYSMYILVKGRQFRQNGLIGKIRHVSKFSFGKKSIEFVFADTGVMYPIVTHWAWAEEGWLFKGLDIKHDGEDINIAYRVKNFRIHNI